MRKGSPIFKRCSHSFGSVYEKIDGNIPVDEAAQLANPVRAIVRRVFFDDEEVKITVRRGFSPDAALPKRMIFSGLYFAMIWELIFSISF